jgi:hypothetical protein
VDALPSSTDRQLPPSYCQYATDACDQDFGGTPLRRAVVLHPSQIPFIASTIETAVETLNSASHPWVTWRAFQTTGQIIFCAICKAMRFADCIVADVTSLNFNVMFEIGFALGLNMPVIPVRDTTLLTDKRDFDELGLLDTLGYVDFQNAEMLAHEITSRLPVATLPTPATVLNQEQPLYVLKGPIETEGAVRLMSTLKKSPYRFRTFDVLETPRLSLQEARRQTAASYGVVAHLLNPDRAGARVHNARCALIAGAGMATGKVVVLLQEGQVTQPIDYRDVVLTYDTPDQIPRLLERPFRQVVTVFQLARPASLRSPEGLLEQIDLGDVAAENEIIGLRDYFVQTAQSNDALRGYARLVVGRKGSGKTAVFYAVRDAFYRRRSHLVLDLKPEGHQFIRLREAILSSLSPGFKEYTVTALWTYLLLVELAIKILDVEQRYARRNPSVLPLYERVREVYESLGIDDTGDFSERLLLQIERMSRSFEAREGESLSEAALTETLFRDSIRTLGDAISAFLETKEEVWVLIDNLDKGWPTQGASAEDILVLRTLLEATRKLQRQLEDRGVAFHCLVFLRNDIHDLLVRHTPDKGKDTPIVLDWDDIEIFKRIVFTRVAARLPAAQSFMDAWAAIAEVQIGAQDSFSYIAERTLMRPRDLLKFIRRCIEVAVNRRHDRLTSDDILKAEESYSNDLLIETQFELADIYRHHVDPLYEFLGCPVQMSKDEVLVRAKEDVKLLELLLWFGFLGTQDGRHAEPVFSYQVRYNVPKLLASVQQGASLVIHPAFRTALGCT